MPLQATNKGKKWSDLSTYEFWKSLGSFLSFVPAPYVKKSTDCGRHVCAIQGTLGMADWKEQILANKYSKLSVGNR
jgi:hypothetical protein